jgi:hypothetical protein
LLITIYYFVLNCFIRLVRQPKKDDKKVKREKGKKGLSNPTSTFKRLFGVKPKTFRVMKGILQKEYDKMHKKGGSPRSCLLKTN